MIALRQNASAAAVALSSTAYVASVAAAQGDRSCPTSPAIGNFVVFAALALIPFGFLAATSYVKLSVVLSILRNALGIGQTPSSAIIALLAAVLTFYVMAPVGSKMVEAGSTAATGIDLERPVSRSSLQAALQTWKASREPLTLFLKRNAGAREIALFVSLGQRGRSRTDSAQTRPDDLTVVLPAFLLTELKEAFQIGFLVYIPFVVVELVVANLLLAMGIGMVSPAAIALPFKLLIFVLVDGWYLLAKALVLGYNV
jgi:type III secretion protein R